MMILDSQAHKMFETTICTATCTGLMMTSLNSSAYKAPNSKVHYSMHRVPHERHTSSKWVQPPNLPGWRMQLNAT